MIAVSSITKTTLACPTQWEGHTVDDREVYARYRGGYCRVYVDGEQVFEKNLGHPLDGCLEYEQLKEVTKGVIEWPEKESPEFLFDQNEEL